MTDNICNSVHVLRAILYRVQRPATRFFALHLIALAILSRPGVLRAEITFTPLGLFGGTSSAARDVSADGSVVVGTIGGMPSLQVSVFRLTVQGSTIRPTGLGGPGTPGPSASVSPDGSTVVGTYLGPNGPEAFRWIGDGAFLGLGDLPGGVFESEAFHVSADGRVIVGKSQTETGFRAFHWTPERGIAEIDGGVALGISPDGTVVVGGSPAFRWTAETGPVVLPALPVPLLRGSGGTAVSADGSVVVGSNSFGRLTAFVDEAFRWSEDSGTVSLQSLPWTDSIATDVSGDGSAIVGDGVRSGIHKAFYWTAETGMLDLQDLLISLGVTNLDGWRLNSAGGISQDGLTIVGSGLHNNRTEAWVATIPEPSTIVLAVLAAAGLLTFYIRGGRRHRGTRTTD